MQVDTQEYLELLEDQNKLLFFDIESNGLKADYGSILCASFKPFGLEPVTFNVKQVGNDQKLVREIREILEEYPCWVSYYGKGFDVPMINSRSLKWGQPTLQSRHHIDLYFSLKAKFLLNSKSMASVASFLGTQNQKMSVPAHIWSEMGFKLDEHMPMMIERCESDIKVLEDVYKKTRFLLKDIKKG